MTLSIAMAAFDDWLNRIFSLGLILAVATGLTLAKAVTTAIDMSQGLSQGLPMLAGSTDPAPSPIELSTLDESNFVPWPTNLPEPAAGPEDVADAENAEYTPFGDDEPSFDPTNLTEGENLALQQLAARRKALDEREELLDMRAELNGRAEARLDEQIDKLAELKAQLEALVKGLDETEELKLARLVKIYETMKPKAAAEIFNRLDMSVLLHVIERMKEAKSAVVLGKMDPVIAKRLTTELARKKERPTFTGGET